MTRNERITKVGRKWRGFRNADRGSTTVLFALLTLPVFAIIGAAVDYSRASAMRAAMQAAVDTTALAVAANAASDTDDQLNSSASTYFNALFAPPDAQNVHVTAVYASIWAFAWFPPWPLDSEGDPPRAIIFLVFSATFIYIFVSAIMAGNMLAEWIQKRSGGRPAPGENGQ